MPSTIRCYTGLLPCVPASLPEPSLSVSDLAFVGVFQIKSGADWCLSLSSRLFLYLICRLFGLFRLGGRAGIRGWPKSQAF